MSSPAVARRWLALELRRLRQDRGIQQKAAGQRVGWSGARLSYFENAQQNLTEDDLTRLLDLYEVPAGQRQAYHDALGRSRDKGWWERSDQLAQVLTEWAERVIGLEQGAAEISVYQPLVVPGLLQTADYVKALIENDFRRRTRREIDSLVRVRIKRQDLLTRGETAPALSVVLGQGVLSESPANGGVMAAQLDRLIEASTQPNITIRVLRHGSNVQAYAPGPFTVLTFPWQQPDPAIVYIEYPRGAVFLEEVEDVDSHILAFDAILGVALSPAESRAEMQRVRERFIQQ